MLRDLFDNVQGVVYGGLGVAAFIALVGLLKATIRVASPDRILVVTGRKTKHHGRDFGFAVDRGRTIVVPYFQAVGTLDLGVFPINVRVEGVNSANGITMGADATACVCIDDDDEAMLYSAVERLMGKDVRQIHEQIQQTLVGNFRGALNKATPLQAIGMEDVGNDDGSSEAELGERAQFRAELLADKASGSPAELVRAAVDFSNVGRYLESAGHAVSVPEEVSAQPFSKSATFVDPRDPAFKALPGWSEANGLPIEAAPAILVAGLASESAYIALLGGSGTESPARLAVVPYREANGSYTIAAVDAATRKPVDFPLLVSGSSGTTMRLFRVPLPNSR